jgi:hypothetical protein
VTLTALAPVLADWDDMDGAASACAESVPLVRQLVDPGWLRALLLTWAGIEGARGNTGVADQLADEAEAMPLPDLD